MISILEACRNSENQRTGITEERRKYRAVTKVRRSNNDENRRKNADKMKSRCLERFCKSIIPPTNPPQASLGNDDKHWGCFTRTDFKSTSESSRNID